MILDFDKYSLILNNERLLVRTAAIHYFRNPGANAWRDRLSKLKAAGYNTVDLYFCWGYHSRQFGVYDFTDIKDIRALLDITIELGLYVIARPGPFINAEISAGGFPPWLFNVPDVKLRNREDGDFKYSYSYMQAVKEWYSRIIPIINEYQNVIAFQIENEYSTNEAEPDYMQELYDLARSLGVQAPIFHNDAFCACLYSDIVNIYACDTYPTINLNYDWKNFPDGFGVLDNLESNIRECSENSPLFIAELQSGWFDKWGGHGYEFIRNLLGKKHINIVTKTALSQGVTMFNHYMGCGGTSWNQLASAEVYTSYDFAALISENGIPGENYYKAKEINYFLQAYNLASTELIADENTLFDTDYENIFARLRQDNLNNCKWLFVRNLNKDKVNLSLQNNYNLSLQPIDMKILPLDLNLFGCKLNFSGLSIFSRILKNNHEIIFLLLDENSEIMVSEFSAKDIPDYFVTEEFADKLIIKSDNIQDLCSCKFSKNDMITEFIFLNETTANKTWIMEEKIAIIGPDFIFNNPLKAAFNNNTGSSEVKILNLDQGNDWQIRKIQLQNKIEAPKLNEWTSFKCAPEIDPEFDYSNWNLITDTEKFDCISNRIYDDYIWYKGTFSNSIDQIWINAKHCYAVYLNGIQIYHHDSHHYEDGIEIDELITFEIDQNYISRSTPNELTVLVQNLGFDKGFVNPTNLPRGIISFKTIPSKDIEWRIRGSLTPQVEEWDSMPIDNLENASSNAYLSWHSSIFEVNLPKNIYSPMQLCLKDPPFNKADIYLNGNLIGRYWKSKGPQSNFYLMDGLIKSTNKLSLVIWDRDNDYQEIKDYHFLNNNVNINIEIINHYNLVSLIDLL